MGFKQPVAFCRYLKPVACDNKQRYCLLIIPELTARLFQVTTPVYDSFCQNSSLNAKKTWVFDWTGLTRAQTFATLGWDIIRYDNVQSWEEILSNKDAHMYVYGITVNIGKQKRWANSNYGVRLVLINLEKSRIGFVEGMLVFM